MSKNVLITGCTGFVGKHLVPFLAQQDVKVFGASRNPDEAYRMYGNLLGACTSNVSKEWLDENKITSVIHLAGIAHDLNGKFKVEDYFRVNRDETISLYNIFLQSKVAKQFIFISSIKALIDHSDEMLTEDMVPDPKSPYGQSKKEAEDFILNHQTDDRHSIILRPSMIYGPGNKGNLNLLYNFVSIGLPWPLAAFDNQRTFLSINNLLFALKKILNSSSIASGVYHVADNDPVSTNEIVNLIGEVSHKKVRNWKLPKALIKFGAKLGDVAHLPLNSQKLEKLTENYLVSNAKLVRALNCELPFDSRDELRKTIWSLKNQS